MPKNTHEFSHHFPLQKGGQTAFEKHNSLNKDLAELSESLLQNPTQGTYLGKNCYKIRLAISSKGKGKSGGARVVTYFYFGDDDIYLLTIYDKSDRENLQDKELDLILEEAGLSPEE